MGRTTLIVAIIVSLACTAFAYNAPHKFGLRGWRVVGELSSTDRLKITVAVRHRAGSLAVLERIASSVSNPSHARYGQHLSFDQLGRIVSPELHKKERVGEWLQSVDAVNVKWSPHGEFVSAKVRHDLAVPDGQCVWLQHDARDVHSKPLARCMRFDEVVHLPDTVRESVDFVYGLDAWRDMPTARRGRRDAAAEADDGANFPLLALRARASDSTVDFSMTLVDLADIANIGVDATQQVVAGTGDGAFSVKSVELGAPTSAFLSGSVAYVANVGATTLSVRVQFVNGTTKRIAYESPLLPAPTITPNVVRNLYWMPRHEDGGRSPRNTMSVAEFDNQFYSESDLRTFAELVGLDYASFNVTVRGDGTNDQSKPGGESTLDVDCILSVAPRVPLQFWLVGDGGFLIEWLSQLAAAPEPPLSNSVSYGVPEAYMPAAQTDRINVELQKAAARGLTIVTTSGDLGAADGVKDGCAEDEPDFPSSSPWAASTGATVYVRDTEFPVCANQLCAVAAERAAAAEYGAGFTTGGGFSRRYARPDYQRAVVDQYLRDAIVPPATWFAANNSRGFNDITALGNNILVLLNGERGISGGTSASGPYLAGIFALLNDARLSNGMAPLGFVNPLLYSLVGQAQYIDAFNHPLMGTSNACQETGAFGRQSCCKYGFYEHAPWSVLSGLGSPNYSILKQAVLATGK
jgi:Pro-kumamolisin, activation domain